MMCESFMGKHRIIALRPLNMPKDICTTLYYSPTPTGPSVYELVVIDVGNLTSSDEAALPDGVSSSMK